MERINNASHRQIVINFYKKNQAKGKPYTIEYFRKLNITRHQVYHAIKRFESGISHKQQLGTGRHSHYGQRRTLRHFLLTNDWPTTDQWLTNIVPYLIYSFGSKLVFWSYFIVNLSLPIYWFYEVLQSIWQCFDFIF